MPMDSFSITEPLVAKGTSLLVMIPGALSATIGNLARKNIHWKVALTGWGGVPWSGGNSFHHARVSV